MKRIAWLALWFLPVASFAGIPIQHWTMPTGAKVYLVEAPGIPMVDVEIGILQVRQVWLLRLPT